MKKEPDAGAKERELLIAASKNGEFYRMELNEGRWIEAGGQRFPDIQSDPKITAEYFEAFDILDEMGWVVFGRGTLYRLTASGFKIARELAAREKAS